VQILIYLLPALLVVVAITAGVLTSRTAKQPEPAPAAQGPLAPPENAPDAGSPACARLLAALPTVLPARAGQLRRLAPTAPAPSASLAWGPAEAPVVLRCGLPRPPDLSPTSELIDIDAVSWLVHSGGGRDEFINVDRSVYTMLTVPLGVGTGPVQTISDVIRDTLPASRR
jgi:hypothetical protein